MVGRTFFLSEYRKHKSRNFSSILHQHRAWGAWAPYQGISQFKSWVIVVLKTYLFIHELLTIYFYDAKNGYFFYIICKEYLVHHILQVGYRHADTKYTPSHHLAAHTYTHILPVQHCCTDTWVLISIFLSILINVWNITQTTFPSFMFMQFHDKRSYYRYSSLNSEANYIYYWEYLMLFNSVKMYSLILLLFFILN